MKRIGLVIALALVGFACADGVGQILVDAGNMIGDGSVPDAGADETVTCNKSESYMTGDTITVAHWAEFFRLIRA